MPAAAAILVLEKGDPAVTYFRLPPPVIRFRCFKHRRRVARDNTVKYHRHTLQLLPDHKRRSYAGAVVVVLEGLDGRLSLQHEGGIIASQEAPPSPGALRTGRDPSTGVGVPSPDPGSPADSPATVSEPLKDKDGRGNRIWPCHRRGGPGRHYGNRFTSDTDFSSEGKVKGNAAGKAQRAVHSRNGEGVGDPQRHGKEIHRRRETAA